MESMEHPNCPHCKDPLREVVAVQVLGEPWHEFLGRVPVGTGVWEVYCGDCFGDVSVEVAEQFRDYVNEAGRTRPGDRIVPIAGMNLLQKLQRQPDETEESHKTRNQRAIRHLAGR